VYVTVILHYDTYYSTIDKREMHAAFEDALAWLEDTGFPMDRLLIVTWRDALDNATDYAWLTQTLTNYGVTALDEQLGLFMAAEDTHDPYVLDYAMETYHNRTHTYPRFVAGFSATAATYTMLEDYGVQLAFFNLWEEGEDYSYRGDSTGDAVMGANWEGGPFQPYQPSMVTINAPAAPGAEAVDLWEAHWVTRNPSYAFLVANSRHEGSLHPADLLVSADCIPIDPEQALGKLTRLLDLVDQNAALNPMLTLSYPIECSFLREEDVAATWRATITEFQRRGYTFVNVRELRTLLDAQATTTPLPVCLWVDNQTVVDPDAPGEPLHLRPPRPPPGRGHPLRLPHRLHHRHRV